MKGIDKMNVMHLISGGDSGGAKTHLFELLEKLKEKCSVTVICLMQGIFYNEILEKDIETLLFEQRNRFDLSVVGKIKKEIEKRNTDILHVHGARANFIAMFLKKHLRIPIVTTIHSDPLLDFDSFVKKIIFTNLNLISLKKIDYYITVSDDFKDMMISRGVKPNSQYAVYNGMDFSKIPQNVTSKEEYAKRHGLEINDNLIYIGIAARFDVVKGVDIFIKGATEAYKKNKNLRFLIAGDGEENKNLKALVSSLGMDDAIKFLGFERDIYGFLNFIDINALTSLCESFPYSMLEGAGMKKPMIASRVGGIPNLVKEGVTGYLFETKNHEELAQKILLLASDKEKISQMGEAIYKKATTNFTSDAFALRHMEIYNLIIEDYNTEKKYDFVLSGYYGFNNSGDDALLLALINDLKEINPNVRLAVLSHKCEQTERLYRVDAYPRMSLKMIMKLFNKSKVLLSGGGSLIQDETSSKSLWYYLYIIKLAKKHGLKVMQIANGIGPVNKAANRNITARIINNNVDTITLRERKSFSEIEKMKISVDCEITADPAISLEGIEKSDVMRIFERNDIPKGEYICLALREWKHSGVDFENNMAKALDHVIEKYGKQIVFLPMQYPVDISISESVMNKMKNKAYVVKTECSIEDMIGIIKQSSLVVAMRLHSLVYAVSCGVGVIALKYDPKIDGFMEYFNQKLLADVSKVSAEELINLIDDFFANDNKDEIIRLCADMKQKAKRNAEIAMELLEKYDDK